MVTQAGKDNQVSWVERQGRVRSLLNVHLTELRPVVKLPWEPDAAKRLAKARQAGKPLESRVGFEEYEERVALFVSLFQPIHRALVVSQREGGQGKKHAQRESVEGKCTRNV